MLRMNVRMPESVEFGGDDDGDNEICGGELLLLLLLFLATTTPRPPCGWGWGLSEGTTRSESLPSPEPEPEPGPGPEPRRRRGSRLALIHELSDSPKWVTRPTKKAEMMGIDWHIRPTLSSMMLRQV